MASGPIVCMVDYDPHCDDVDARMPPGALLEDACVLMVGRRIFATFSERFEIVAMLNQPKGYRLISYTTGRVYISKNQLYSYRQVGSRLVHTLVAQENF